MANTMKFSVKQIVLLLISVFCNIYGLLTIMQVNGLPIGLNYMDSIGNLLFKYLVVLCFMMPGIMLFGIFATTFQGKVKNILSITNCVYSTILTVPLFLTMVLGFAVINGSNVPMVGELGLDIMKLFPSAAAQYIFFILGTILSIVFLAEPIIGCYLTTHDVEPSIKNIIGVFKKKKTEVSK